MDVNVEVAGSIVLVFPLTDAARQWIDDHINEDAPRWCGGIAVEPRYAGDLLNGMAEDGLDISV